MIAMRFETSEGPQDVDIEEVIVAGWTGRDAAAVTHHIDELAELGVAPPSSVPLFYRVSRSLLTQSPSIQVLGDATSGEVEPLLIHSRNQLWLGLASDHTDRQLETVSVAASKQICAKPVSASLWSFAEVENHLDQLILRCDIEERGAMTRYQEGTLSSIRPLRALVAASGLGEGDAMLCGTLAAIGGVRSSDGYRMELFDPVLDRSLRLAYTVTYLPVVA